MRATAPAAALALAPAVATPSTFATLPRLSTLAAMATLLTLFISSEVIAAMTETGFLDRRVTAGGRDFRYQVFVPSDYTAARAWPVILFLHGSGERGDDGLRQTEGGLGDAIRRNPERVPFLVVFPQAPADSVWLGAPADAALAALDATLAEFHADRDRVILSGLSMGGYGAWHLAWRDPGRFAAIVVVCGGVVPGPKTVVVRRAPETLGATDPYALVARRVAPMPAWLFHGADDPIVPVGESREMARALRAAGAAPRFTEYPGVGHGAWEPAYADSALWTWLAAQRRAQ